MHGGIAYCTLYLLLLGYGIINAIFFGKNKFVKSVAVMLAGYFFNFFVGDLTGCYFFHMMIFMLLGCCLSSSWINLTDKEIYKFMHIYKSEEEGDEEDDDDDDDEKDYDENDENDEEDEEDDEEDLYEEENSDNEKNTNF